MPNLAETDGSNWPELYQIENGDPQSGGVWDEATKNGLWNAHATALIERTNNLKNSVVRSAPVGCEMFFAGSQPPDGWLFEDRSALSRTAYADLWAHAQSSGMYDPSGANIYLFGPGDGSTTFQLPETRGEAVRVWDNGRGVDPGRVLGSGQASAVAAHTHDQHPAVGGGGFLLGGDAGIGNDGTVSGLVTGPGNLGFGTNLSMMPATGPVAGGGAPENRMRNVSRAMIIKY